MTEEERANWDEAVTRTIIGKQDGSKFLSFLSQREIRPALSRYVLAESRSLLWSAMSVQHGSENRFGVPIVPGWLDKTADRDCNEADSAWVALEVALQEEVEKRVAAALAEARTQAKKTTVPRLRELTRHMAATVRRSAAEQQQEDFASTEDALEAAGLKSKARKKPATTI